jgi:hypothetical protein
VPSSQRPQDRAHLLQHRLSAGIGEWVTHVGPDAHRFRLWRAARCNGWPGRGTRISDGICAGREGSSCHSGMLHPGPLDNHRQAVQLFSPRRVGAQHHFASNRLSNRTCHCIHPSENNRTRDRACRNFLMDRKWPTAVGLHPAREGRLPLALLTPPRLASRGRCRRHSGRRPASPTRLMPSSCATSWCTGICIRTAERRLDRRSRPIRGSKRWYGACLFISVETIPLNQDRGNASARRIAPTRGDGSPSPEHTGRGEFVTVLHLDFGLD